jgi:hypothetical protein
MTLRTRVENRHRLHLYLGALFVLLLFLASCGSSGSTSNLAIVSWGPNGTRAGVAFNAQPNGVAAFWVNVDRELGSKAYITLNGFKLNSTVSGKLITAAVPATLYAQPGTYPLNVVDVIDGKEVTSNSVNFVVKPK